MAGFIHLLKGFLIVLGFNDTSPLSVILCCLQEEGRREIEETVEEVKERDRGERGITEGNFAQ